MPDTTCSVVYTRSNKLNILMIQCIHITQLKHSIGYTKNTKNP